MSNVNPASGINLPFGAGAGYYFSSVFINGIQYPLVTFNNLSSSFYIDQYGRDTALRYLNVDPSLLITVRSAINSHEFTSTYNPSADLNRMYFKLDLSTVGDILQPTANYGLISQVSAQYVRISESEAIGHSRDVGLNVATINLDYRDQFLIYAKDTSALSYVSNEFNYRSLNSSTTSNPNQTLVRNIPQALILSPGNGSFHNPFNSESRILDYSNSSVVRFIRVQPNFNRSNREVDQPALESNRIYFELSSNHLGLYEQYLNPDFHGFLYTYNQSGAVYSKSYFRNGEYSDVQPPSSMRTNSIEGSLVSKLVKITSELKQFFVENPGGSELFGFLTWYDVYRRLTANQVSKLKFTNFNFLSTKLTEGFPGIYPVRNVTFGSPGGFITGIPNENIITNDLTFLNEEDRARALVVIYPEGLF